jgi:DNA-binding response OmpR family regulator
MPEKVNHALCVLTKKVLFADDHFDTVETMKSALTFHGFEVAVAYDGSSAIQAARRTLPHAILLDVSLPKTDGFEVARTLRQSRAFSETLIIAHSGYAGAKYYNKAREAGVDFYILKPADLDIVIACLEPEKHAARLAQSAVISALRELKPQGKDTITKVQALSFRGAKFVRVAQAAKGQQSVLA